MRRALSRATLPVLLKGDLDAAKAQMVAAALRLSCATAKNDALPRGRLVVEHRVDWRVVLHGDETSPGRIEKRHLPVRGGEQVPAAEDLARIGSPVAIAAACGASWR